MSVRRMSGYALCVLATCLAVSAKVYHVAARPEWTEPQAFRALWMLWLAVVAFLVCGAILLRGEW